MVDSTRSNLGRALADRPIIELEWRKRAGSLSWHFGADDDRGSFVTLCNGSWEIRDDFEMVVRPAHEDRCDQCERTRIDRIAIERGLGELAENFEAAEFGGEG
jgi:hypothetical protein